MKRFFTMGLTLWMSLAFSPLLSAEGGRKFAYRFTPTTDYRIVSDVTISFELAGGGGSTPLLDEFLKKRGASGVDPAVVRNLLSSVSKRTLRVTSRLSTGQGGAEALPFTLRVISIESEPSAVAAVLPFDPKEALKNAVVLGRLHPTTGKSEILAVEGVKHPMLQEIGLADANAFIPEFPARPLKVGDTFENSTTREIPIERLGPMAQLPAGSKATVTRTTTYRLEAIEGNQASFEVKRRMTIRSEGKELSGKGEGTGSARFDLARGIFSDVSQANRLELTLTRPGSPPQRIAIDAATASRIEQE